ncbi:hypothetical protein MHK_006933 [Candidatus Magnetomorum sp. HK-1]|nr:hypothetical protein MHK_006933 [Candidatus Magnetomorum sp. HK-1]
MMITFGFITEGVTDQIIIEYILNGFFNSDDIDINELQPIRDETDKNRLGNYGGWTLVFEYCKSTKFREALTFFDYIIIQIDTDVCEEKHYGISKRDNEGNELKPIDLIEKVKKKFKNEIIGNDLFTKYEEKIIFAISVHSIECWLLPLYYADNRKGKITNCLRSLNDVINKRKNFTIDQTHKNPRFYEKIAKQFLKHKTLMKVYKHNPSLKLFIEEIENKQIVIDEDEDF